MNTFFCKFLGNLWQFVAIIDRSDHPQPVVAMLVAGIAVHCCHGMNFRSRYMDAAIEIAKTMT